MSSFDLIIAGTGFASSFFLLEYLKHRPDARVLVLERGRMETHEWKVRNRHLIDPSGVVSGIKFQDTYENHNPEKPWIYTPSFGGSSNCWFACTPRFLPSDFKMRSLYGVGADWPLTYDELEPYYAEAEEVMQITGPSASPYPRSGPYPQPAHNMNDFDRALQKAFPGQYFTQPCARPTIATKNRVRCCGSMSCNLCPADAKFTVMNELSHLYQRENVELRTENTVVGLRIEGGLCKSVVVSDGKKEYEARGDLFALGTNPIFNAHILLNSGVTHPWLGRGLSEQVAFSVTLDLGGIQNFSGSTVATGYGYMGYDGPHRAHRSGFLLENLNFPKLRLEPGRYRERAFVKFIFEDLPSEKGRVVQTEDNIKPAIHFDGFSDYMLAGVEQAKRDLPKFFGNLPIERIDVHDLHPTEGHSMGTVRMGESADESVVDRMQVLHQVRNVLSLGGSSFATGSPSNPTLTIAALSMRSARHLVGAGQTVV